MFQSNGNSAKHHKELTPEVIREKDTHFNLQVSTESLSPLLPLFLLSRPACPCSSLSPVLVLSLYLWFCLYQVLTLNSLCALN